MKMPDFGPLTPTERSLQNYWNLSIWLLYQIGSEKFTQVAYWAAAQPGRIMASQTPTFFRRWRHLKRGSTYVEVERVPFQRSTIRTPVDGDEIIIYRCIETGKAYARMTYEFEDGRFEEIK